MINLSQIEELARNAAPADGIVLVRARETLEILESIRRDKATIVDLLHQLEKAKKDKEKTQYIASLWIKALHSVLPKKLHKQAIMTAANAVAAGLRKAGIDTDEASLAQLEPRTK